MGFYLTTLKMSPDLFVFTWKSVATRKNIAARTDHNVDVFVHEKFALIMTL